jgi:hypothetical protein
MLFVSSVNSDLFGKVFVDRVCEYSFLLLTKDRLHSLDAESKM